METDDCLSIIQKLKEALVECENMVMGFQDGEKFSPEHTLDAVFLELENWKFDNYRWKQ